MDRFGTAVLGNQALDHQRCGLTPAPLVAEKMKKVL